MIWQVLVGGVLSLIVYLWHANRGVQSYHAEASKLSQKDWTKEDIRAAYLEAQKSPIDIKPFLFSKKNRRYVVTGGSGVVGGWIVHHLMMRGEDPKAIRIVDLSPSKRREAIQAKIDFVQTDVSDVDSVTKAFSKSWPDHVESLPLSVFHCVGYINPAERKPLYSSKYVKINVQGTKNILQAAKAAGATCFIATSSGSIAIRPPKYFLYPWQRHCPDIYQFLPNAEPKALNAPLENFGSCYAWSKAQAEYLVNTSNDPKSNFLTGAIRPSNAIYGHGARSPSSLTWDYLRRGGSPSWIFDTVSNFVNAQNVSIGHLAYENALITKSHPGGKGYCVTDPNPPLRYKNLYNTMSQLAHPLTPVKFNPIPHIPIYLVSHFVERYDVFRKQYLPFLPGPAGDLAMVQPATFNVSTVHLVFTDTAAQEEIGYCAPIGTKEGFALALLDWNRDVEEQTRQKVEAGTGGDVVAREESSVLEVPKPPLVR